MATDRNMAADGNMFNPDRREVLKTTTAVASGLGFASVEGVMPVQAAIAENNMPPNMFEPVALPSQPEFKEGLVELPDTKVYYRDYGGTGVPLVLMHAFTGSVLSWGYQIPAFVKAGYRVIAYSRRGHYKSDPADPDRPWQPATDLRDLMDKLGVGKFCAVATAAGCSVLIDFAMDHPDRLHAIVASASAFGDLEEPEFRSRMAAVRQGLDKLSPDIRELGPAYRAANSDGAKQWSELEHHALSGNNRGFVKVNKFTWATLGTIKCPTLFLAGGADLNAPPTLMRMAAEHVPGAEMVVVPDTGHSIYWENPDFFNATVLAFLNRHAK